MVIVTVMVIVMENMQLIKQDRSGLSFIPTEENIKKEEQ